MPARRILIYSIAYYPLVGGAEIAVKEVTDRIADHEFDMITWRHDSKLPLLEKIGNITVHRLDTSKVLYPIEAFLYGRMLHLNKAYDIVWSIMAAYGGFAAMFLKTSFPKLKFVLSLQEGDPIDHMKRRARFVSPLFKRIFTKADMVQAISNHLADYARAMGAKARIEVVPNGVDFEKFQTTSDKLQKDLREKLGYKQGDVVLVTTSRLVKKNAIEDIIDALSLLPANYKLLIIGTGPLEEVIKQKIINKGVEGRTRLMGYLPYSAIPHYLHASDIFIRPSLSEGFGNSFIEAMATGLPVVATPVGGIVDFLFDPERNPDKPSTGLFVNVGDPESIKDQVLRLVHDPGLKRAIIENGRKLVAKKYDWSVVAESMRKVLE